MKKLLLLFLVSTLSTFSVKASHLMGGEITWECLGSGKFIFTLKIYRDCNGSTIGASAQTLIVSNYPGIASITLNYQYPSHDLSPICNNPILQKSCGPRLSNGSYGTAGWVGNNGAVEELIYKSNPVTLTGVPGPNGWVFSWSLCCRNGAITNLSNPATYGMCLRSKMFSYNQNGNNLNVNNCFDNSPQFSEKPVVSLCTGYPFTFSEGAYDKDMDSLAYIWDKPLDEYFSGTFNQTNPIPVTFDSNYTYSSPFPTPALHPQNIAATIDPYTGEINYTSFTQGNFVAVVKVSSYRHGQLISEVYRDYQHIIQPCGINNHAPLITAPFNNASSFDTTITAGDAVHFSIQATDNDLMPVTSTPQMVAIFAGSDQFDSTTFSSSSTNCNKPPCAGISSQPGTYSQTSAALHIDWQTSCENLKDPSGNYLNSKTYYFNFSAQDDYCPFPAIQSKMVKINLVGKELLSAPQNITASILPNCDVVLKFIKPQDLTGVFNGYFIYGSDSPSGNFTLLDSSLNYLSDSILLPSNRFHSMVNYLYILTRSGCTSKQYSENSDTLQIVYLIDPPNPITTQVAPNGDVTLKWSLPLTALNYIDSYLIYASTLASGPFAVYDSITNLHNDSIVFQNTTANSNPIYFYMQSRSHCGGNFLSANSDTISTWGYETNGLFLTPNPADYYLELLSTQVAVLNIYTKIGEQIKTENLVIGVNRLDISNFKSGIYFLQWKTKNYSQLKKLIVLH
jgi:hypothetical protein